MNLFLSFLKIFYNIFAHNITDNGYAQTQDIIRRIQRSDKYREHTFEQPYELTVDDQDKLDNMNIYDDEGNIDRVLLRNKIIIHLMKETGLRLATAHILDEKHVSIFDVNKGNSHKPMSEWAVKVYFCIFVYIFTFVYFCIDFVFWHSQRKAPKQSHKLYYYVYPRPRDACVGRYDRELFCGRS